MAETATAKESLAKVVAQRDVVRRRQASGEAVQIALDAGMAGGQFARFTETKRGPTEAA